MKTILSFLVIGLLTSTTPLLTLAGEEATNQPPPRGNRGQFSPEQRVELMNEHLDLTAEQNKALLELFEGQRNQFRAAYERGERPSAESMMRHRQSTQAAIEQILTAEQRVQWEAVQLDMRSRMREQMANREGQPGEPRGPRGPREHRKHPPTPPSESSGEKE